MVERKVVADASNEELWAAANKLPSLLAVADVVILKMEKEIGESPVYNSEDIRKWVEKEPVGAVSCIMCLILLYDALLASKELSKREHAETRTPEDP